MAIYQQDITLGYDYRVNISYKDSDFKVNSTNINLVTGTLEDYNNFRRYHYLDNDGRTENSKIILARVNGENVGIGILVPPLSKRREDIHPYFKMINSKMITGHRTVVHPEFRGTGVGKMLAVDGPKILGYEIVESRSTLYSYIPIPLEWGYNEYVNSYFSKRPNYNELEKFIEKSGFNPSKLIFNEYCEKIIDYLDKEKLTILIKRDEDERHKAQLYYYCTIMEYCGYKYEGNLEQLVNLLVSIDDEPKTRDEFVKALVKHRQAYYRSFYLNLKK